MVGEWMTAKSISIDNRRHPGQLLFLCLSVVTDRLTQAGSGGLDCCVRLRLRSMCCRVYGPCSVPLIPCLYMCIIPTLHVLNPYIKQKYSRGKSSRVLFVPTTEHSTLRSFVVGLQCQSATKSLGMSLGAAAVYQPSALHCSTYCNLWAKESVFVYKSWILKNSSQLRCHSLPPSWTTAWYSDRG